MIKIKYFLLLLAGLAIGFIFRSFYPGTTVDTFYDSQSAMINGQIISVNTNRREAKVKNKKNQIRTFILASNLIIVSNPGQPGFLPTGSSNLKNIQLNQEAGIALQNEEGKLEVISIVYAPIIEKAPVPPPNPSSAVHVTFPTISAPPPSGAPPLAPSGPVFP